MLRRFAARWLLLPALLLGLLPTLAAPTARAAPLDVYTALGDSIARGVGATGFYGYVDRYHAALLAARPGLLLLNAAVPGFDSGDLLAQLRGDPLTRAAVRQAQVLTISIGGNNLLPCASDNYTVLDTACAARGVRAFRHDWPKILREIRHGIGSEAALLVMTLYNPYRGDEPAYAIADSYIQQLNAAIGDAGVAQKYRYAVVEVHAAFQGQFADGSWKVCAWTHFCEVRRDPHPTDSGHQQIADLHVARYP